MPYQVRHDERTFDCRGGNKSVKDVGRGTGLGLSTVYGIVKQNRGYVWVDSEPGEGAAFEVYLPVHESGANGGTDERIEKIGDDRLYGTECILVAEDEEMVRGLAVAILVWAKYAFTRGRIN